MSPAAWVLLTLVFGLILCDGATLRGNRRAYVVEVLVFLLGGFFIVWPERATAVAHLLGIGRGVDFLLYPTVIWLTRESLLARRRRLDELDRTIELARALALATAQDVDGGPEAR